MNGRIIKVLLVDDHRIVRQGIRALLQNEPDIAVVDEAADGNEGIELAARFVPDVVVLDYSLPGMEGDEVIRRIRRDCVGVNVLVLSCHADAWHIEQSLRAGALGYVTKFTEASDLLEGIRAVARGEAFLGGHARAVFNRRAEQELSQCVRGGLSKRQREVLGLIAQECVNKEIAAELGLSIKTVEKHRQELMKKLDIHSAAGLTRYAVEGGFVPLVRESNPRHAFPTI